MTVKRQASGMRTRPVRSGCGPAVAIFCLSWLVVGLPVLACVLGWVTR